MLNPLGAEKFGMILAVPFGFILHITPLKEPFLLSPLQLMSAPFSKSLHTASSLAWLLQLTMFAQDQSHVVDTGEIPNCFDYEETRPRSRCLQ